MKRVAICAAVALLALPLSAQFTTTSGDTTTQSKVGIGVTAPGANLEIGAGVSSKRFLLSGAEYYQSANGGVDGIAFLLGVNRTGNRQLWIADSARTTANTTNTVLRLSVFSDYAQIDAISTDISTKKLLVVGNVGNVELATGGGKVGIGTNLPATMLHVSGVTGSVSPYVTIDRPTGGDAGLVFRTAGASSTQWLFGKPGSLGTEDLAFGYPDFATGNLRLVLTTNGNIGIGRNTPITKLDVNGAIRGNSHLAFLPWTNVAPTSATGYVRLLTPIAAVEGNFFSLHILGYRYSTTATTAESIDIRCSAFAQSGVGLTSPTCTALGTDLPVQLVTEGGYAVVRIGTGTTAWSSSQFSVEYDGAVAKDPAGFAWSVASTSSVSNMNNVAIRNSDGGVVEIGQPPANPTTGPFDQTLRLKVHGSVIVDGNIGAKYQDVAEWVPVASKLSPGTVVIVSRDKKNEVMASTHAYDTAVAGVVSAQPGLILGEASDSKAQIATTGRVKVHVDATRRPIKAGDLLVTGDKPGTAMLSEPVELGGVKLHRPGTLVGKALEALASGEGDILVLLSLQ